MSNDRDDDESSSYIGSCTLKPGRLLDDLSNSGSGLWNPIKLWVSEIDRSSRYVSDSGLVFSSRGGGEGSIVIRSSC